MLLALCIDKTRFIWEHNAWGRRIDAANRVRTRAHRENIIGSVLQIKSMAKEIKRGYEGKRSRP